jgi:death-on-curing protein
MSALTREPEWLDRAMVEAIHDLQLNQHGGLRGIRDVGALESALGRPRHKWVYGAADDLSDCAAAYGFGIAKNHPFADGNKRTAFQAMYTFLGVNGIELIAPEADAVTIMIALATDEVDEAGLATWLRDNTKSTGSSRGRVREGRKVRKAS